MPPLELVPLDVVLPLELVVFPDPVLPELVPPIEPVVPVEPVVLPDVVPVVGVVGVPGRLPVDEGGGR